MTLPNGLSLSPTDNHREQRPHFIVPDSTPLPTELLTNISYDGSPFAMYQRDATLIDDIPTIALTDIYERKSQPTRVGADASRKAAMDRYDANIIMQHFRASRRQD